MQFSSGPFLMLFLPITLLFYFNPFAKSREYRNICLLLASFIFYFWGEPLFVLIMCISILVNWFLGKKIGTTEDNEQGMRKGFMITAVVFDLLILFIFKYLTFTLTTISAFWKGDTTLCNWPGEENSFS